MQFLKYIASSGAYVAASKILFHNLIHLKEQKIHKLIFLTPACVFQVEDMEKTRKHILNNVVDKKFSITYFHCDLNEFFSEEKNYTVKKSHKIKH